jgi:hypothetical protein
MSDFWTQYETSRTGEQTGEQKKFYGERECCIFRAQVDSLAPQYDPALGATGFWPGATGVLGAQLFRYRLNPWEERGKDCKKLVLCYHELTPHQALRPGRAVLMIDLSSHAHKVLREPAGQKRIVAGPDPADPSAKWVVVSGTNVILDPQCHIVIRTVVTDLNLSGLWMKIGQTNDAVLPNFGNAPANSLMFMGMTHHGLVLSNGWRYLDYHFGYNRGIEDQGWVGTCQVQKQKKFAVMVQDKDENKVLVPGSFHRVMGREMLGIPESRDVTKGQASFSDLNGQLAWY